MDLSSFRKQWFINNLFFYIFLVSLYVFIAFVIFKLSAKPIEQVRSLNNIAHRFIEEDTAIYLPVFTTKKNNSMEYAEFKAIELAFVTLSQKLEASQSEKKELRIELENSLQRQKQGFYKDFQYMITRELNKTVSSVSTGVKILRQQYLGEEQQDAVSIIRNGSVRLGSILEQVLLFDKIDNGHMTVHLFKFNSLQLFSDVIDEYKIIASKKGLELQNAVSHQDYMLEGDIDKIRNILVILLDNAIKYTSNGSIKVESDMQHFDSSTRWTVRVTDTGIGIDEKYWNDIFIPFFQVDNEINTTQEGIGIGLTLAKQLTELMGGSLSIRSDIDKGSDFELTLPLMDRKQIMEKNQLSGLSIVIHQNKDTYDMDLQSRGGQVKVIDNVDQTISYCVNKRTDVLLINADISESNAIKMTQRVRSNESAHRSLIIWLHASSDNVVHDNKMKSAGVDVILHNKESSDTIASVIKDWV